MIILKVSFFVIFWFTYSYASDTSEDFSEGTNLPPITVTATRLKDLRGGSLTSITREDIKNSHAESFKELLNQYVPSLDFRSLGGSHTQTSVFTRGTNSNHTVVYINKVRANQLASGIPPWEILSIRNIVRVDVIEAASSGVYGSQAIGGAINIQTSDYREESFIKASVNAGSFQTDEFGLEFQQHLEKLGFKWSVSCQKQQTEGYDVYEFFDPDQDGSKQESCTGNILYDRDWGSVQLDIFHNTTHGEYDRTSPYAKTDEFDSSQLILSGSLFLDLASFWDLTLEGGVYKEKTHHYLADNQNNNRDFSGLRKQLRLFSQYNFSLLTMLAGYEITREQAVLGEESRSPRHDVYSFFTEFEFQNIHATYRLDRSEDFHTQNAASLGYSHPFFKSGNWHLTISKAYRNPSLNDIYSRWNSETNSMEYSNEPNSELKSEISHSIETGVGYRTAKLFWKMGIYWSKIKRMIHLQRQVAKNHKEPIDLIGLTARLRADISDFLELEPSIQILHGEDEDGNPLLRRSPTKGGMGVTYLIDLNNKVGVRFIAKGSSFDKDYSQDPSGKIVKLPSYMITNLWTRHKMSKGLELKSVIKNVFNKNYRDAYGYRNPGREFSIQMSWEY